jgi:hypothetical protein
VVVVAARALLVGTNGTSTAPLHGCINDIQRTADLLVQFCGFAPNELHCIPGDRATTASVRAALNGLVQDLQRGDRVLFMFSGHGTRLRLPEDGELHDVVCPWDFDGTLATAVTDQEFQSAFAQIPDGVSFVWISDSCHSGDLAGDQTRGVARVEPATATTDVPSRSFAEVMSRQEGVFLAACSSDEDAREDQFRGVWRGAFSFYLLSRLAYRISDPMPFVVADVRSKLRQYGFAQTPVFGGSPAAKLRALFQ